MRFKAIAGTIMLFLAIASSFVIPKVSASHIKVAIDYFGSPNIADTSLVPGTTFTVNIIVTNIPRRNPLSAYQFNLGEADFWEVDPAKFQGWNASILKLLKVENGPFLGSFRGTVVFFPGKINNTQGTLTLTFAAIDPPNRKRFPSGSGTLAILTFEVVGIGASPIRFGLDTALFNSTGGFGFDGELLRGTLNPDFLVNGYFDNRPLFHVTPELVADVPPGENFTVSVNILDVTDLYAYSFYLNWSSSVLNATDVVEGNFLPNATFISQVNNTQGFIYVNSTRRPSSRISGSGTLANITFQVKETANTSLHLFDTLALDSTLQKVLRYDQTADGQFVSDAPTTTHDYDGLWHNEDFNINLTATDNFSGVAETFYKINDGPIQNVSANGQPLITVESANNTLEYWSIDNAGIEELHKILTEIKLDKTAPTGSITINNDDAYTNSISVTLTLTADDVLSGIAQMRFSNDNVTWTPWETYAISKAWTLTLGDGTTTVFVQFMDNAGLNSSIFQDTIILDTTLPTANAGNDQTVKEDMLVTFDASDSTDENGIVSYMWTFTDVTQQTLTGVNPAYIFQTPGTYTVTLNVTDAAGNWNIDTVIITVLDITRPLADAGPTQVVNEDMLVTFDASDSWDNDPFHALSYTWTFVDVTLQTLTGVNPTYTFPNPGVYTVTLTVTDAAGNWDTDTVVIIVLDVTDPVADAGLDQAVDEDTLVAFDGSGSTDNVGVASYMWAFTDGGALQILTGERPTYNFTNPGVYMVTLKVSDAAGNWNIDTVVITVLDITDPVADAGLDQAVDEDTLVAFDGSGSTDNVGVASYMWAFTDNGKLRTLTGVSPNYIFATPGVFTVTLNVTDAAGRSAVDEVQITVRDVTAPVANAGSDQTVNEDTVVTFDGSASRDNDPSGIISYTWTFTDVTPQTLEGKVTNYTFATPGVYILTLNVTDALGKWGIDTVVITVVDVTDPVASAGQDQTVNVGETVTFDASGSSDNVGVVRYEWDFGDRTTGTGKITTHTYPNAGTYTVTLTVKDTAGNIKTHSISVTILSAEAFPLWAIGVSATLIGIGVGAIALIRKRGKET